MFEIYFNLDEKENFLGILIIRPPTKLRVPIKKKCVCDYFHDVYFIGYNTVLPRSGGKESFFSNIGLIL